MALIGVRPRSGADWLILKLARRKNLSGGCVLKRMCPRAAPSHQAQKIPPPHRIWPIIQEMVPPGGLVPPHSHGAIATDSSNSHFPRYASPTVLRTLLRPFVAARPMSCSKRVTLLIPLRGQLIGGGPDSEVMSILGYNAFRISRCRIFLIDSDSSEGDRKIKGDKPYRRNWRKRAGAQKPDTSPGPPQRPQGPMNSHRPSACIGRSGNHPPPILSTKRTKHHEVSKLPPAIERMGSDTQRRSLIRRYRSILRSFCYRSVLLSLLNGVSLYCVFSLCEVGLGK